MMHTSSHELLDYDKSKELLKNSTGMQDINHYMHKGDIKSYKYSSNVPANSPFGSYFCLEFPFSTSPSLANQFKKLNYNTIRVGKLLQVMDSL